MIVYPAYAYMGKAPSVPDFPFWENGKLNVSTTGSYGLVFYPDENQARLGSERTAVFSTDAVGYGKLKFNAVAMGIAGLSISMIVDGSTVATSSYTIRSDKPADFVFTIPEAARKKGVQFKFTNGPATIIFYSIVLTN